jgi:di/tricarboxylate transporter
MIVVLVGAFVELAVVTALHGPQTVNSMVDRMDVSTLGLLFGLMTLIQVLSTTGGEQLLPFCFLYNERKRKK